MNDWTGNKNSIFKTIAASNHCTDERQEHDYYATDPKAVDALIKKENLEHELWEPACGEGHLSKRLIELGHNVLATDLIYRNYGWGGVDFLLKKDIFHGSIITNPPYKYCTEFILKALELITTGHHVYMFLKLTALEGKDRYDRIYSKHPPKKVYVFSKRIVCAKNGVFEVQNNKGESVKVSSAVAYAWYVWEKGYNGPTIIEWI